MKILGIFRGFPGLGRVVSGVSICEELKNRHGHEIKLISYLQGEKYLTQLGYSSLYSADTMDYCSIGLLPTGKMGAYIHAIIRSYKPDVIIIDGEPLMVQSIKISHPNIKVVVLLNPADVDNPSNDKEAMDFFNYAYSRADLAIVHGLRKIVQSSQYNRMISLNTIIRPEILQIQNIPNKKIYCILGGGTVNVGPHFISSTMKIADLCIKAANDFSEYQFVIICSSKNISDALNEWHLPVNVIIRNDIVDAVEFYTDASLVITRSGRNTLSELMALGIPAISFITGDIYRIKEQEQNLESIEAKNIIPLTTDIILSDFENEISRALRYTSEKKTFTAGNNKTIDHILELIN